MTLEGRPRAPPREGPRAPRAPGCAGRWVTAEGGHGGEQVCGSLVHPKRSSWLGESKATTRHGEGAAGTPRAGCRPSTVVPPGPPRLRLPRRSDRRCPACRPRAGAAAPSPPSSAWRRAAAAAAGLRADGTGVRAARRGEAGPVPVPVPVPIPWYSLSSARMPPRMPTMAGTPRPLATNARRSQFLAGPSQSHTWALTGVTCPLPWPSVSLRKMLYSPGSSSFTSLSTTRSCAAERGVGLRDGSPLPDLGTPSAPVQGFATWRFPSLVPIMGASTGCAWGSTESRGGLGSGPRSVSPHRPTPRMGGQARPGGTYLVWSP